VPPSDNGHRRGLFPLRWDRRAYDPRCGEFPEIPPVLPDSGPSSCGAPPSGIDLRTGKTACSVAAWAARLNWCLDEGLPVRLPLTARPRRTATRAAVRHRSDTPCSELSEDGHEQALVRLGDRAVTVDREIAPLIQALNDAGVHTLTSCKDGYVMFLEPDWRELRDFWRRNQPAIGAPVPSRTVADSRDAHWLRWMQAHYPPHFAIRLDRTGQVTTVCWLFDPDELREVMPALVRALQGKARARRAHRTVYSPRAA